MEMSPFLVLLGPPGSGKGTQAIVLSEQLKLPHVNVGEMFREAIRAETPVGVMAKQYLDKGELVPDAVVIRLVGETLAQAGFAKGFVLDGFPRTLLQAEELENLLKSDGRRVEHAVSLKVTEDRVLERLTLRKVCTQCGAVYHEKYSPPKVQNQCDRCPGALSTRGDDNPEVVEKRLRVYEREFRPIIDFYKKKKLLREIDGNQSPEQVTVQILKQVKGG